MLGNDIVDLQKAARESNWKRKGYLDKIFTANEQLAILTAPNPNTVVWLLWSMKEAVYKIVNRETLTRFYSPHKFECKLISMKKYGTEGSVIYNGVTYFTKSETNPNYIYSIATSENNYLNRIGTVHLENTVQYRQRLHQENKFTIQKDLFGIPEFRCCKSKIKKPISITHHGRYLAIAYKAKTIN